MCVVLSILYKKPGILWMKSVIILLFWYTKQPNKIVIMNIIFCLFAIFIVIQVEIFKQYLSFQKPKIYCLTILLLFRLYFHWRQLLRKISNRKISQNNHLNKRHADVIEETQSEDFRQGLRKPLEKDWKLPRTQARVCMFQLSEQWEKAPVLQAIFL